MTTDTADAESLRTFATEHNELAFAHLVTAALAGEVWAIARLEAPLRLWAVAGTMTPLTATIDMIRTTDTTRPDGAIDRAAAYAPRVARVPWVMAGGGGR